MLASKTARLEEKIAKLKGEMQRLEALERRPSRIRSAVTNGRSAFIDGDGEENCDRIITDIHMPGMSGFDLKRLLDARGCEKPVIMVSADAMGDRVEQLIKLGAVGYLTKPYKLAEFLRVIQETLRSR